MRKIIFVGLIVMVAFCAVAAEKVVLAEMGTATWCTNCPIAYEALDNVAANHPGAVITCRYYDDAEFGNDAADARLAFYSVHSYPTTYFDGSYYLAGTQSEDVDGLTALYENLFQQAFAEGAPVAVEITALDIEAGTATISVTAETDIEAGFYSVYFMVAEDGLSHNGHEYNDVCRIAEEVGSFTAMAADENQVFTAEFAWDAAWDAENCQAIACVQETISRHVLQAAAANLTPAENAPVATQHEWTLSNYPNPFNPETNIEFSVPVGGRVSLKIYNVAGQLVKVLADDVYAAGRHSINWNGTNENGKNVASGVYFYRMESGQTTLMKKMILMK